MNKHTPGVRPRVACFLFLASKTKYDFEQLGGEEWRCDGVLGSGVQQLSACKQRMHSQRWQYQGEHTIDGSQC